MTVNMLP